MPPKHPQLNSFISPDGSIEIRVLKSGENQIIERQSSKLEILGNGKQICPLISMRAPITDLTFSPDGKLFVIGSHNYVELRDTSAPLRVYWSSQFQYMRVDRLLFSSNSKQIVAMKEAESGGLTVGETAIWQANRKKEKGSPEEEKKRQEEDKRRQEERERRQEEYVVIYDTQTGKQICEFMIGRYSDWYYSFRRNIVISPVYLLLTSGDKKGTINFWDTSPGWKLSRRVGTLESAYAFGVSDDGRFLATISETDDIQDLAIIYIRDLPSRKILRTIRLSLGIPQMIADAIHLGYSEPQCRTAPPPRQAYSRHRTSARTCAGTRGFGQKVPEPTPRGPGGRCRTGDAPLRLE